MESKLSRTLKALADDTRLRMLNLLQHHALCVCELETLLGINQSNASRHLNKLTNAGLLDYYKSAKYVYYKINPEAIEKYRFIKDILTTEVTKLDQCREDYKKMAYYKSKGYTCDDLKAGTINFRLNQEDIRS